MLARVISVLSLFVLVVGFATAQDITAIHGKWIGTSEDDRGNVLVIEKDVIVLGGRPIREPVAWMGPFVMNTREELMQAMADYQAGRLGTIPAIHNAPTTVVESVRDTPAG